MEFEVKITGSGTATQITQQLKKVIEAIEAGDHLYYMEKYGKCEWEDHILMTEIKEVEHESAA